MKRLAAIVLLLLLFLNSCGLRESEVSDGGSEEESYETSFPPLPVPDEPRVLIGLPLWIKDDVYADPDFNLMEGVYEQDAVYVGTSKTVEIYGVPFTTNTWFLYYNKKVYSDSDVKSLDTMLEKGKVAFPLTNSWYDAAFYLANGCTLFGDGTDNDAGINFGGDNGKAVTDYLVDLVANKNFVNDESGVGISGMTDGSIAAMFSGSWDYKALHDALGDDLGIAAMPTAKIGGSDKQLLSFAGSKAIGVNPNCEYPQVAVALALYLGNEESQQSHYEARSIVPCNTNLLESDTVKNDALVTAQNDTFNNTSMIQPFVPKMSNFWTPAENFGKALLNGEVTHDNAAEQTEAFNTSLNTDVAE